MVPFELFAPLDPATSLRSRRFACHTTPGANRASTIATFPRPALLIQALRKFSRWYLQRWLLPAEGSPFRAQCGKHVSFGGNGTFISFCSVCLDCTFRPSLPTAWSNVCPATPPHPGQRPVPSSIFPEHLRRAGYARAVIEMHRGAEPVLCNPPHTTQSSCSPASSSLPTPLCEPLPHPAKQRPRAFCLKGRKVRKRYLCPYSYRLVERLQHRNYASMGAKSAKGTYFGGGDKSTISALCCQCIYCSNDYCS